VPTRVYVYINREWGDRRIGSIAVTLIEIADRPPGDIETIKTAEGSKAVY